MTEAHHPLAQGKIPNNLLKKLLAGLGADDPTLRVPPGVGEDAAVVAYPSSEGTDAEELLVLKSDPITFLAEAAARYLVEVNANDIATTGAVPRWMLVTALFPPESTFEDVRSTVDDLRAACSQTGISLCGGHMEITDAVTRPVLSGMLVGTVTADRLLDKRNIRQGDAVLLTKHVGVEGTAVLAQEMRRELLDGGVSVKDISLGESFVSLIGIGMEARAATEVDGVRALHDVTEGGVATALEELSEAGGHGVDVDMDKIPIHPLTRRICSTLGVDPLGLIGSGSLLIVCAPVAEKSISDSIRATGSAVTRIGWVGEPEAYVKATRGGRPTRWPTFAVDEAARILEKKKEGWGT